MFGGLVDSFFKESGGVLIIEVFSSWILSLSTLNKIVISGVLEEYRQKI